MDNATYMRDQIVALCEDTEHRYAAMAAMDTEGKQGAFASGRIAEAKSIRNAMCEVFRELERNVRTGEVIERVARAICAANESDWDRIWENDPVPPYWEGSLTTRDDYRCEARAAIEAMREPTGAMLEIYTASDTWEATRIWRDMIGAALGKP